MYTHAHKQVVLFIYIHPSECRHVQCRHAHIITCPLYSSYTCVDISIYARHYILK